MQTRHTRFISYTYKMFYSITFDESLIFQKFVCVGEGGGWQFHRLPK